MEIEKGKCHEIFNNKDILQNIFFNVANLNTTKDTISKDLFELLFVCKTWYKVAVPILYSKIIYNGGITRGVYQGTYTRLETIAKFIKRNKELSIKYHIYNYFNVCDNNGNNNNNNNNNKMDCSPVTSSQQKAIKNDDFFQKLEFMEVLKNQTDSKDSDILNKLNNIVDNINSLKISNNCSSPLRKELIFKIHIKNNEIFNEIIDLLKKVEMDSENFYQTLRAGIDFLKIINDNLCEALPSSNNQNLDNTLFVPDIYSKVRVIFFNKTDQIRTVDQLFSYKSSFIDFIGNCENITVLSFGSKHDKQHLLMEKDLYNLFSTYSFPHLKYLVFNNLKYITGETSFSYIPSKIEAIKINYCKNVTVDSIIALIQNIGQKLKLLSLKDSIISVDLLNTIVGYCKRLICVDISYNKAEKGYVKTLFPTQIQNIIILNKNLKIFNVYGILDLKNIQKIEQLYPQVKLYNNENLMSSDNSINYNNKIWHSYLENDLNIKFKYSFDLPKPDPEPPETENDNIFIDNDITSDSEDMMSDESDILFI